jgi:hypothetical protein
MTHHENDYGLGHVQDVIERSQNDGFMYLQRHGDIAVHINPLKDARLAVIREYLAVHELGELISDRTGGKLHDVAAALVRIDELPVPVIVVGPSESVESNTGWIIPSGDMILVGSGGFTDGAEYTVFGISQGGALESSTRVSGDLTSSDDIINFINDQDITHLTPAVLIVFSDCNMGGIRGVNVYAPADGENGGNG